MRKSRGQTLPELLTTTFILAIVLTVSVTLFVLSNKYYTAESQQVDVQFSVEQAVTRLVQEVQESNPLGIYINAAKNAIVFVSARNSSNIFQTYNGLTGGSSNCGSSPASDDAKPCWQKWVCYYLSGSQLIRMEGDPTGTTFPTTTVPSAIPTETDFQTSSYKKWTLSNISSFAIESQSCNSTITSLVPVTPIYFQLSASESWKGEQTTYSPGSSAANFYPFNSCAGSGNWNQINVVNLD